MEPTTPMIEIEAARMAAAYRTLARQMLENRLQIEAAHMKPREGDTCWRPKPGAMGLQGALKPYTTQARTEEKTKRRFDWELSRAEGGALLYEAGIGRGADLRDHLPVHPLRGGPWGRSDTPAGRPAARCGRFSRWSRGLWRRGR